MSRMDTRDSRINLASLWLVANYLILLMLSISHNQWLTSLLGLSAQPDNINGQRDNINRQAKNLIARYFSWLNKHNNAFTFVLVFSTVTIFEEVHRVNLIYNLTIAFSFTLILYRVILFIKQKSRQQPYTLDLKTQKIYISYASFIALCFFFSTTVDSSDYGTEFQLTILSWLMLFYLIFHWGMAQWKLVKQLQNERTNAQLMHLKSQVNPHFLFNTLNNLYGLALEKSDQTPELILKLSDMLRYTIYQGQKDQVLLRDEVNYLEDFIKLQQIRYHKPVNIIFEHEVSQSNFKISPLLLLILLENAYKHGVEQLTDQAYIAIKLEIIEQSLIFNIENNFDLADSFDLEDESEHTTDSGIGLVNLKTRLALIYPASHQLEITSQQGVYRARLEIELKNEEI